MSDTTRGRVLARVALLLILAATTAAAADTVDATATPAATESVDLNSATTEQLTTIPGIGEAMAQRIIDWREEHGPFRRVEDLMKVKGIGERSLEKIRPHVSVGKSK